MLRRLLDPRTAGPLHGPLLSVLRIMTGALFMQHGAQKLLGMFGGVAPETPAKQAA